MGQPEAFRQNWPVGANQTGGCRLLSAQADLASKRLMHGVSCRLSLHRDDADLRASFIPRHREFQQVELGKERFPRDRVDIWTHVRVLPQRQK